MNEPLPPPNPPGESREPEVYPPYSGEPHSGEHTTRRSGNAWLGGAILLLLGFIFLLQNLGVLSFDNWWALFILIPAFGAFSNTWRAYQSSGGRLTRAARGSLLGGLVFTAVSMIFLFDLNWTLVGPVLMILAGVGLLVNAFLPG